MSVGYQEYFFSWRWNFHEKCNRRKLVVCEIVVRSVISSINLVQIRIKLMIFGNSITFLNKVPGHRVSNDTPQL